VVNNLGEPQSGQILSVTGDDKWPSVAYNSLADQFTLMWANSNPTTGWDLIFTRLDNNGILIPNRGFRFIIDGSDKDPFILFNPSRNEFAIVFDNDFTNSSDINFVVFDGALDQFNTPLITIGGIINTTSGERLHEHEPQLTLSTPGTAEYLLLTELDLQSNGDELGRTDIIGYKITPGGAINSPIIALNQLGTWFRARNPSLDFSISSNEFFVSFEVQQNDLYTPDVYAATFATDLTSNGVIQVSNGLVDRKDHAPSVQVDPNTGRTMVTWTSGNFTDEKHTGSKRMEPMQQEKLGNRSPFAHPFEANSYTAAQPLMQPVEISTMELLNLKAEFSVDSQFDKRALTTGSMKTAMLCLVAPPAPTTGTPSPTAVATATSSSATSSARSSSSSSIGIATQLPTTTTTSTSGPIVTVETASTTTTTGGAAARSSPGGISAGLIAAAIIIPLVVIIALIVGIVFLVKWRQRRAAESYKLHQAEAELDKKEQDT
jgi:hypothetical protein